MTVLAAMPRANVTIAVAEKARFFVRTRRVNFRSRPSVSAHPDVNIVLHPPRYRPLRYGHYHSETIHRAVRNGRTPIVPDISREPTRTDSRRRRPSRSGRLAERAKLAIEA